MIPINPPTRYLTRMALFTLAVIALGGFLWQPIWTAFQANIALNGVIVAVLILGIGYVFRQVLRLRPEIDWLKEFMKGSSSGSGSVRPRLLAPMEAMLADQEGQLSLSASGARVLLDGIAARLDEGREISRYLAALLIFLGLLGTFWGLLQTVSAVGDVVGSLNTATGEGTAIFAELQRSLEQPIAGMSTAFSSSLFGLAGSLVLGFLDLQAGQAQNRFYTDLEDWLSHATRIGGEFGRNGSMEAAPTSIPAWLEGTVSQTSDNLEAARVAIMKGEQTREQTNAALIDLNKNLATLTGQLHAQQQLMLRLGETQAELKPAIVRLAEVLNMGSLGEDEASLRYLRNIEATMTQMLTQGSGNRDYVVQEVGQEIRRLGRVIGALAASAGEEYPPELQQAIADAEAEARARADKDDAQKEAS
ncbi:MAG: hypothetical protein Alpg2KO_22940 [Alphaproteobacteria bacterium]